MCWAASEILFASSGAAEGEGRRSTTAAAAAAGSGNNNNNNNNGRPQATQLESAAMLRCQVVTKLIAVTFRLVELNNLHSAFAIYCAMRHPAVTRLRQMWAQLPVQSVGSLDELHRFFGFEKGYRGYKEYVASVPDDDVYPLIPIMSVMVDEVRRVTTSEPTVLRDAVGWTVLHWRKYDVLGTVYDQLHGLTGRPIPSEFTPDAACVDWLREAMADALSTPEEFLEASFAAEGTTNVGAGGGAAARRAPNDDA
jgi:hypothetical protein